MTDYSGAYSKGSDAGGRNNELGKEAEYLLETALTRLGLLADKHFYKQRRVPYLSPERFKTISTSFVIPKSKKLSTLHEKYTLYQSGGPNIVEDFIITRNEIILKDNIFPVEEIETIISVTQANPTKPGHSIENKLHQSLGELYLHKVHNPNLRSIIFIGGTKESWGTKQQFESYGKSYSLETIKLFYDDCVCVWEDNLEDRIKNALKCELKNKEFWEKERIRAEIIELHSSIEKIPNKNLRNDFLEKIIKPAMSSGIKHDSINNKILAFMFKASSERNGSFHKKLLLNDINGVTTDRSFNNPPEAAMCMLLAEMNIPFYSAYLHGPNAVLIKENLLYDLGYKNMHRYTDLVIRTKSDIPIYIECKSAGGGHEGGHKHITDRAREQIARSLLKRTKLKDGVLISGEQKFKWVFILDADWHTPKVYPQKFIHTLQLAGVTEWFSAYDLVDHKLDLIIENQISIWLKSNT